MYFLVGKSYCKLSNNGFLKNTFSMIQIFNMLRIFLLKEVWKKLNVFFSFCFLVKTCLQVNLNTI